MTGKVTQNGDQREVNTPKNTQRQCRKGTLGVRIQGILDICLSHNAKVADDLVDKVFFSTTKKMRPKKSIDENEGWEADS